MERISFDELLAEAQQVWTDKRTVVKIAKDSYGILCQVEKRKITFYSGRRARALVGGLFYLMGYRYDEVKKQNELAYKLSTTDVTIRRMYREWLTSFPDLFVDVIGKLSQDESLRYYILIDFKRSQQIV